MTDLASSVAHDGPAGQSAEVAKSEAALDHLKPLATRPNDEQLVAHLTAGSFAMTDQVSVCAQLGFSTTAKDHGHVGGLLAGKIGSNKFVADYAVDSRAKCRDTKCNAYILQSDLRIGKIPPSIKTGHSCRTHWYHLPCIFRSFRRACKGTKTITSVNDIANFDRLRPSDQQHIRICIQCAKNSRDRSPVLPPYKPSDAVSDDSLSPRTGCDSPIDETRSPKPEPPQPPPPTPSPPKLAKKRKSLTADKPQAKKAMMKDMNVSEHEVAGILGLTMLSQPGADEEGKTKPDVPSADRPAEVEAHANPPQAETSERDAVLPVDREQIPPEWRLGPKFSSPKFTEEVSRRWRVPGTRCEFLYRDQWHVGVIESYTSQEAIVKFENREGLVPIDLVTEKHRVCWQLGTYTSQSNFA